MGKWISNFATTAEYNTGITNFVVPHVSLTRDNMNVHYLPETKVVAKFNLTSTSNPTRILNATTAFSSIEIDGVVQPSVTTGYTFSTTGEHTVKYTLTDPTIINGSAFTYCVFTSVTIPNSVTSIGQSAFQLCSNLTSCTIGDSVTSIGGSAFTYCSSLTSCTIGNSVETIASCAFSGCTSLTSITMPNSVTYIGDSAFKDIDSVTSIVIPDSVTYVGDNAFRGNNFSSVIIGSGVINIGAGAFQNCDEVTSITCKATTAPIIQSSTFQSIKANGTLFVPQGSSGYDTWMGTGNYYLGLYNWTKVEQ